MELHSEFHSWKITVRACLQSPSPLYGGRSGDPERESDLLRSPLLVSGEAGTVTQVTPGAMPPCCLMILCCPQIISQGSIEIVYESFKCKIQMILGSQRAYKTMLSQVSSLLLTSCVALSQSFSESVPILERANILSLPS